MANPKKPSLFTGAFGPIDDENTARVLAGRGGGTALFLLASELIGACMMFFGFDPNSLKQGTERFDQGGIGTIIYLVFIGVMLVVMAFMTWRIWAKRGYVSAALMFCLMLFEAYDKMASGVFLWGGIFAVFSTNLLGAVRANWYLRKGGQGKRGLSPDVTARIFDDPNT